MNDRELQSRLSRISTMWTTLRQAHAGPADEAQQAQSLLLEQYRAAAFRYLAAVVGDADAAEDLFQDFAVRFLRGDFHAATPQRGRFRDYLKTALVRLVIDFRRKQHRALARELPSEIATPDEPGLTVAESEAFEEAWRGELLALAWERLEQASAAGQPYHAALLYRSEFPQATAGQMAAELSARLQPPHPYSEAGMRKILQRAREKFADHLLDEVACSLSTTTPSAGELDAIEAELIELKLLPYCRSALDRRRAAP